MHVLNNLLYAAQKRKAAPDSDNVTEASQKRKLSPQKKEWMKL